MMSFGIFYPRIFQFFKSKIQPANFFFVVKIQIFNEETSFRDFLDFFLAQSREFQQFALANAGGSHIFRMDSVCPH